jgi:hypothetical protein
VHVPVSALLYEITAKIDEGIVSTAFADLFAG